MVCTQESPQHIYVSLCVLNIGTLCPIDRCRWYLSMGLIMVQGPLFGFKLTLVIRLNYYLYVNNCFQFNGSDWNLSKFNKIVLYISGVSL